MSNQHQPQDPGQPADHPEATATVAHEGSAPGHAEPTAFGLTAPAFISLAMIVVIAIIIWKKVPCRVVLPCLDREVGIAAAEADDTAPCMTRAGAACRKVLNGHVDRLE